MKFIHISILVVMFLFITSCVNTDVEDNYDKIEKIIIQNRAISTRGGIYEVIIIDSIEIEIIKKHIFSLNKLTTTQVKPFSGECYNFSCLQR